MQMKVRNKRNDLNEHHFFELGAGFNYKNTDDDVDQLRLKNDTIVNYRHSKDIGKNCRRNPIELEIDEDHNKPRS